MEYANYERNHAILPGREAALEKFLNADYEGMKHKLQYAKNSNSEDALTWTCFDFIRNQSQVAQHEAVKEIFEDAYSREISVGDIVLDGLTIDIGRTFTGPSISEKTEVDASIETNRIIVFFEAKLYNSMSPAEPPERPFNQIARKLRVGFDFAQSIQKSFYFIVLDIAPVKKMYIKNSIQDALSQSSSYKDKWKTAWWYDYYKNGRNNSMRPLREILSGISVDDEESKINTISKNMGWLTWADLFKITLRSSVRCMARS
jgi:hypothetical protein